MDPPALRARQTIKTDPQKSALKALEREKAQTQSPLKFFALEKKRHCESKGETTSTPPTAETFEFRPEAMEPDHQKLAKENQDLKHQISVLTAQLTKVQTSMLSQFEALTTQVPAASPTHSSGKLSYNYQDALLRGCVKARRELFVDRRGSTEVTIGSYDR